MNVKHCALRVQEIELTVWEEEPNNRTEKDGCNTLSEEKPNILSVTIQKRIGLGDVTIANRKVLLRQTRYQRRKQEDHRKYLKCFRKYLHKIC